MTLISLGEGVPVFIFGLANVSLTVRCHSCQYNKLAFCYFYFFKSCLPDSESLS